MLLVLLAMPFISCTEKINDISYATAAPRLSVYGNITTDTTRQQVILTENWEVLPTIPPFAPVSNADVTIADGTTVFPLTEDPMPKGHTIQLLMFMVFPGKPTP